MAELNSDKKGVCATRAVLRGKTIFTELPLALHAYAKDDQEDALASCVNKMAKECVASGLTPAILAEKYHFTLRRRNSAHNAPPLLSAQEKLVAETLEVYTHVVTSNFAFPFHHGLALYALTSKINHSCAPNAMLFFVRPANSRAPAKVACVAQRDISEGDELFISYAQNAELLSRAARCQGLSLHPGIKFGCHCALCASQKGDAFIVRPSEISQMFAAATPQDMARLDALLNTAADEVAPGLMEDALWAASTFGPAGHAGDAKHARCEGELNYIVTERLVRLFMVQEDPAALAPRVLALLEALPPAFWRHVETSPRVTMRMLSVCLFCFAEDIAALFLAASAADAQAPVSSAAAVAETSTQSNKDHAATGKHRDDASSAAAPGATTQKTGEQKEAPTGAVSAVSMAVRALCARPLFCWMLTQQLACLKFDIFIDAFAMDARLPSLRTAFLALQQTLKMLKMLSAQ